MNYVTVLSFKDASQAQYHYEVLENAGIPCRLDSDVLSRDEERLPLEPAPDMGGPVLLRVPEEMAKQAGDVLEENFEQNRGGDASVP